MSKLLDELASQPALSRKFVSLEEGEELPLTNPFVMPPPEGMRWETDDEFRKRIQQGNVIAREVNAETNPGTIAAPSMFVCYECKGPVSDLLGVPCPTCGVDPSISGRRPGEPRRLPTRSGVRMSDEIKAMTRAERCALSARLGCEFENEQELLLQRLLVNASDGDVAADAWLWANKERREAQALNGHHEDCGTKHRECSPECKVEDSRNRQWVESWSIDDWFTIPHDDGESSGPYQITGIVAEAEDELPLNWHDYWVTYIDEGGFDMGDQMLGIERAAAP